MENIFEGAKFGDKFRTRDGRMAIFCGKLPAINLYRIVIEGNLNSSNYSEFGTLNPHAESLYDIIGKWEEPINEEELAKLAEEYEGLINWEYNPDYAMYSSEQLINAYQAGYRKAKGGGL